MVIVRMHACKPVGPKTRNFIQMVCFSKPHGDWLLLHIVLLQIRDEAPDRPGTLESAIDVRLKAGLGPAGLRFQTLGRIMG